jgi:hypothetical protein
VIILNTLLRSDIGLKPLGLEGFSTFGIRIMREELILSRETFPS